MPEVIEQTEQTWTTRELATRYKIDPATVARLVRKGQLPKPLMVGGSVRFRVSDVKNWETANRAVTE